jgi:predicted PurR-regulated permease PerM
MLMFQLSTSIVVATIFLATIFIFLTVTISAIAQAKNMNGSINNSDILATQTTQNKTQTAIQTDEQVQQEVNQTSGATKVNANDSASNSSDVTKNIRKNLTEVAKKLDDVINKKLQRLAK